LTDKADKGEGETLSNPSFGKNGEGEMSLAIRSGVLAPECISSLYLNAIFDIFLNVKKCKQNISAYVFACYVRIKSFHEKDKIQY
jgi:hypothetical protein